MIVTVCPSPCIDVNIEVDSLSVGMSNKIISKKTFYTGKALNVAIGLARLKEDVFATGFMYEENGVQFERELHREGVPYRFIWSEGRVRENYKFIDHRSMLTEVDDISPCVGREKQNELISFISSISQKLVKPNLDELERTLKRALNSKEDMLRGCREILDKGAQYVLLSLGKKGAIITDGNKSYHCKSVNVAKNSTVGAGDGMVAAAAGALVKGADMKDVLRCGVAAGTAAVTSPESISFKKDKYEEILSSLTVEEI